MGAEKLYRVELFLQGEGWQPYDAVLNHSGVVDSYDDGLKLGLFAILKCMEKHPDKARYGSRRGDVVALRIVETDSGKAQPIPDEAARLDWRDHKHKFFKRGNAYTLYKSWSWPD